MGERAFSREDAETKSKKKMAFKAGDFGSVSSYRLS